MGRVTRRRSDLRHNPFRDIAARFVTAPMAALAAAAGLFAIRDMLPPTLTGALPAAFWVFLLIGAVIGLWFRRSRVFFALSLLGCVSLALSSPPSIGFDPQAYQSAIRYFCALIMPLSIFIMTFVRDRSLFSPGGRRLAGVLLLELLFIAVVVVSQDRDMMGLISREMLSSSLAGRTTVPFTPLMVSLIAFFTLGYRLLRKASPVESAFFYSLPLLAAAFHFEAIPAARPLFLTAAAAALTLGAIQDSYALAYLDELTGLPGRRALQDEMSRLGETYTIAMVDIDHFKRFNDQYGHDVGDDALRLVSALAGGVSGGGRAFRYGGEEFAVLFPGRRLADAMPYLEDLREGIAQRPFFLRGKKGGAKRLSLTVSIGAAERCPRLKTAADVIKAADQALYRAKDQGRDCVCM